MDFRMREALRKSRIFLLENVIFDVLTDHLIDQDVFSNSMLDYIKAGSDRLEKIRRLLDNLIRRPDDCYEKFLMALVNSGHEHCAHRIRENFVRSGPTQVSEPIPQQQLPPGLPPDEDVPMESSCSWPEEKTFPHFQPLNCSGSAPMGLPEILTSMQAFAGSFSVPVQESSHPGGDTTPNNVGMIGVTSPVDVHKVMASLPSSALFSVYQQHILNNPHGVYKMESSPRGLALVINNEKFETLPARTGSEKDMENLHLLFKRLGFHICHEKNKTAKEIRDLLKAFAEYPRLKDVDALVVVILSHGGQEGIIFGTKGSNKKGLVEDYIKDEDVRDAFSAINCPLMVHKPKLIIIKACRGLNEDMADGVRPTPPPSTRNHNQRSNKLGQDGGTPPSSTSSASSSRTANMADICMIHSTVHGYVSYRHPIDGSPFIQEMTQIFQEMADREHLTDMMTEVNRKLASRQLSEDVRTVPSTTNTLTKKWFFNPPTQL